MKIDVRVWLCLRRPQVSSMGANSILTPIAQRSEGEVFAADVDADVDADADSRILRYVNSLLKFSDYHAYVNDLPFVTYFVQQELYDRVNKLLEASPRWSGELLYYHVGAWPGN